MIMQNYLNKHRTILLWITAIAATMAILWFERDVFWRPYNDEGQESLVSFAAHDFAITNYAGFNKNPIVAHRVYLPNGTIVAYNHWPNGFFATLALAIKIFGNSETTGRSVAIAFVLAGAILMLLAVNKTRNSFLMFLALPLFFLNPAGRDSIPFVFADAALFFFIGLTFFLTSRHDCGKIYKYLFRIAIFVSMLFSQLIIPYFFVLIIVKYIWNRDKKEAAIDLILLLLAFSLILIGLSYDGSSFASGFRSLYQIFLHRSSLDVINQESVSFVGIFKVLIWELHGDFNWPTRSFLYAVFSLVAITSFIIASWIILIKKRDWLAASLLPAFVLFALILKNYVGAHHFTRLPFVFFSIITVCMAMDCVLTAICEKISRPVFLTYSRMAAIVVLSWWGYSFLSIPQWYNKVYDDIDNTRNTLAQITSRNDNQLLLVSCTAMEFRYDRTKFHNPEDRIAGFYLDEYIIRATKTDNAPTQKCLIDLDNQTVLAEK